jgi:4-diphosphocytidyl-2-C-methyl-D-erythritol kinase
MTTGSPQPGVVEAAPAKLNLALHVTGLREDGYHELESLVTFCRDACDRIRVENADSDRFSLSGSMAAKIEGGDNLALRARDWLREKRLSDASPVAVHLEKTLPVSSGIGGGSADAAATLRGLCRLWSIEIDTLSMDQLAFDLGADVPMCLKSRPALASGIGERLTRVPAMPEFAVVLVNPGLPVSTPAVFRVLPNKQNPTLPRATPAATDLGSLARLSREHPQRLGSAGDRARARDRRHSRSAQAGARAIRPHVRFRRDLLRHLRHAGCSTRRRRLASHAPPPAGMSPRPEPPPARSTRHEHALTRRPFIPVGIAVLTVSDTRTPDRRPLRATRWSGASRTPATG